jgi:ELWxxDGT repeat protein
LVKSGFFGTLELADVGGIVYFGVNDTVNGSALWRSDGTAVGTTLVKAINPPPLSTLYSLTDVQGTLYFLASNRSAIPSELWRSDGTGAGTTLVKTAGGVFDLTSLKRVVYFTAGGGLWRSDGTPQGTTLIRGNRPGGYFGPRSLTPAGALLYLVGTDKKHGEEVWRSDGTRKGTRLVRDIHRGTGGSDPTNLTAVGKSLFFTAKGGGKRGRELWRAGAKPGKPGGRGR